jgi:uncharacterized protein YdeI (YjbR/CyaY-like superfamily)
MEITKTLYVKNRNQWRAWLQKHHEKEKEIWLVYYKVNSSKPRIPYNDAVEESLCFGWIDSIVKKIDDEKFCQRFTPRKNGSNWSETNKERVRRLIKQGKMTPAGMAKLGDEFMSRKSNNKVKSNRLTIPSDILEALKQDEQRWKYFARFPLTYKRIRISWIDAARHRPDIFQQRLRYFLKMTSKNKRYGMVQ